MLHDFQVAVPVTPHSWGCCSSFATRDKSCRWDFAHLWKALNVLNGRKRNANATFAENLKSTCILKLLHLGPKDVESITASVLTIDIFVGVSLIHDQQERVFITLDSFEKQAKGLIVTHIACQDSPGFQKLITCSNIFEAKLDCQAPCTRIA